MVTPDAASFAAGARADMSSDWLVGSFGIQLRRQIGILNPDR
jgi:hypothetical protein